MASITLVENGAHRLRYLIEAEGTGAETVVITTIGDPLSLADTLTDSVGPGTIKQISKVVAQGYGQFALGAQTQAKAQALWLSQWNGADPGNSNTPTASCRTTPRSGGGGTMGVSVNVNAGNPEITVSISGGGDGYLDIETPGTIGD